MVSSYYGIYQAERGKSAAEIRAADTQLGGLAAELGQLGSVLAAPVRTVRRSLSRQRPAACPAAPNRMRAGLSPLTTRPGRRRTGNTR